MHDEKITVTNTDSGQSMEVVVLHKRVDQITIVIGEGIHNVQCELTPTRTGQAYAGSVMGREMVYQKSRDEVQAELDLNDPALKKSRKF